MTLQILLALFVLSDVWLYFSSRLMVHIRLVAFQGLVLGVLPLLVDDEAPGLRNVGLAALTILIKAVVLPGLLARVVRRSGALEEPSVRARHVRASLAAVVLLGLSVWLADRLPAPLPVSADRILAAAFFTVLSGIFLCVSRTCIASQALGVIVLENGVVAASLCMGQDVPMVIELGLLMDVALLAFVLVVLIRRVREEFQSVDVDRLSELRD